jgi:Histone acetylation protein/TAZ zinc finger/Zinc finger, ZZ type
MLRRYSNEKYPTSFPVRSKCISLFQKIHGADTLLFSMYVYEYGHKCPSPNRRRVYISYLDSVQYFEPKCYRTLAYQAILIEYLRFVKERGFHTAHIWSCPPTPGDDYIFYCHPSHQLTPREDMLRAWYHQMLERAKALGVVIRTTTMYEEYFMKEGLDTFAAMKNNPTCLPYFEGDYIPGEIENIIRNQRNAGKAFASDSADEVMQRLGHNLAKMKDNFIVVHLRNRKFALAVERGEDVSNWKEDSDDELIRSKRANISGKDSSMLYPSTKIETFDQPASETSHGSIESLEPVAPGLGKQPLATLKEEMMNDHSESQNMEARARFSNAESKSATGPNSVKASLTVDSPVKTEPADGNSGGLSPSASASTSQQNAFDEIEPAILSHHSSLNRPTRAVADTVDEDTPVESEMFESRQQFLNYCQTNHCQFDELRRAKHSTMMVLFQLHNPLAPKFLQQCGVCYRDIMHGIRYHCNDCSNFDLCQDCYEPVTTGLWAQRDARFAHEKSHTFSPIDMETSEDSPKNREDREKSLQAHLELLEHTGSCKGVPGCSSQNCQRIKKLFDHVRSCDIKPKKDCKICLRLLSLCAVHARMCAVRGECPIPFCDRIRERNQRLRRQQQLMDDRRRVAQNELYHAGGDS